MDELEIRKAAASLNGKRSWNVKVKKLGKRKASAHMKAVRAGKKLSTGQAN